MRQINTLIKTTHNCNLRCKYCFHQKYGYTGNLIKIENVKKYIDLLDEKYSLINIVWHGGEPLLAPIEFYEEIYDYCDKKNSNFRFSVQTNGTLLDDKKIKFFKDNNTGIGLSFDGLNNEQMRSRTSKILDNIQLLQDNGYNTGAIMVVNQANVFQLIEEYEYFKEINLGLKLNPMFIDGAAKDKVELYLNPDDYINNFINLFKYWTKDINGNINISNCSELVDLVLNEHSNICTHSSCLTQWLCLDTDSNIYPCDRLCYPQFLLGNVEDINDIESVFETPNFIYLLDNSVKRREKCIEECEYYKNCYSGCNANLFLEKEQIKNNNLACYIQKNILKELKKYILEAKKEDKSLNPMYQKILRK